NSHGSACSSVCWSCLHLSRQGSPSPRRGISISRDEYLTTQSTPYHLLSEILIKRALSCHGGKILCVEAVCGCRRITAVTYNHVHSGQHTSAAVRNPIFVVCFVLFKNDRIRQL